LPASAIDSNADSPKSFLFFGLFAVFLLGAGAGVYFIRRKKNAFKNEGDDFEILDE
jgi:LPXTG-motif cell wall-anchored protein